MATIRVYNAERMKQIEDETVISGHIDGDNLMLETREGNLINAGNVRGSKGDQGDPGEVTLAQLDVVSGIANSAMSKANAASSAASSAIAIAGAAKEMSRGRQISGSLTCEWIRFNNGIQIIWGKYGATTSPAWTAQGALWTTTQLFYILYPFSSETSRPAITAGEGRESVWGGTWAQTEFVLPGTFNIRLWSAISRPTNRDTYYSYIGIGYWKIPG